MDDLLHWTYSVFPSSEVKKDVTMSLYQKHTAIWRLECEANPETTIMNTIGALETQKVAY